MAKNKKICLDESQVKRLQNDTAKIAKGIDDGEICPTVAEMYEDNVDPEIREQKKEKTGGRGKKDILEKAVDKVERKAKNKVKSFLGSIGELF